MCNEERDLLRKLGQSVSHKKSAVTLLLKREEEAEELSPLQKRSP